MKKLLAEMLQDCSDRETFCFSIRCGECGQVFKSRPVRFSKAGVPPSSECKRVVYDTLYAKERNAAREAVLRQALEVFNLCPICRRIVCNRCFLICEDLDMCRSCAASLQEKGRPVMPVNTDGTSLAE